MSAQTPTISTSYDFDSDRWVLTATSYGRTEPAGPRLFRAEPYPEIEFSHETESAAKDAAEELTAYLEAVATKRMPSKGKRRRAAID